MSCQKLGKQTLSFFPIGDFHIESMEHAKIFSDYLNRRAEDVIVLLGDVIHFANSIWNVSNDVPIEEKKKNIPEDVSIWEKFIGSIKKTTIYYLGSHEMFGLGVISNLFPSLKPKISSRFVCLPKNLELISIGRENNPVLITGFHIPDNIHPNVKSEKFLRRKKLIEKWITNKAKSLHFKRPKRTYLCTHDPTDSYYVNLGYNALTKILLKYSPKVHYHAHIHSNIKKTVIGKTPSVNRSFVALSRFEPEALEPATPKLKSLYDRDV